MDLLALRDRLVEGSGGLSAHVDAHVLAHPVLLVHDPAADARKAPVQIRQYLCDRGASALDLAPPARVGVKRGSDEYPHQPSEAAWTE